jgi:hypothetical protein
MLTEGCVLTSHETSRLTDQELDRLVDLIAPIYLQFYPSSSKERILRRLQNNKATVVDLLCFEGNLDSDTLVVRGVYNQGQGREDATFFSVREEKVRNFFKKRLTKCDAFIVVVPIK